MPAFAGWDVLLHCNLFCILHNVDLKILDEREGMHYQLNFIFLCQLLRMFNFLSYEQHVVECCGIRYDSLGALMSSGLSTTFLRFRE